MVSVDSTASLSECAEDRRHASEFDMPTAIVTTPATPEPQPPVRAS
jgi:hypothetical protein